MRAIKANQISQAVEELAFHTAYHLGEDVVKALEKGLEAEISPTGQEVLGMLIENARIAALERFPLCQDTGLAVIFVEMGQDARVTGGDLDSAVQEGVRRGFEKGYLCKSVCHPFSRVNTGDNTPAIVHVKVVPGDRIRLIFAAKGGGSENMSKVVMLRPSDGMQGVIDCVVDRVRESGANPCPPVIIGVGIGGTFEKAALIAKEALLRPLGDPNPDPEIAGMEEEILARINELGIGPGGFGGRVTCLAVHVDMHPCHIASLPVGINVNCHAHRHRETVL